MPKVTLIDIAARVRDERPLAWQLDNGMRSVWVPKSKVEDNGDGTFTMPEWMAKEKGLI